MEHVSQLDSLFRTHAGHRRLEGVESPLSDHAFFSCKTFLCTTLAIFGVVLVAGAVALAAVGTALLVADAGYRAMAAHILGQPLHMLGASMTVGPLLVLLVISNFRKRRQVRRVSAESARYRQLYDHTPVMMHSVTLDGTLIAVNSQWLKKTGYTAEEVIGKRFEEFLVPESRERLRNESRARLAERGFMAAEEFRLVTKFGTILDLQISAVKDVDAQGRFRQMLGVSVDVTRQVQVAEQLAVQSELNRVILQSLGTSVVVTDPVGNVTYLNPAAEQLLKCTLLDAMHTPLTDWAEIQAQDPTQKDTAQKVALTFEGDARALGHATLKTRAGAEIAIQGSVAPLRGTAGARAGAVLVLQDVSEARQLTHKMIHLARHDLLTGLPNRLVLQERVQLACHQAQRRNEEFCVMFLDLDRFKYVNDSLGHAVGDELLKEVAERLTSCLRKGDTVCRMGGDEFVILLSGPTTKESAIDVAQKVIAEVSRPYSLSAGGASVSTSIGVARFPVDGEDPSTLLKHADVAMYRAKSDGRNCYKLFTRELDESATLRLHLEASLREALNQGDITVHYQPQVDAHSGSVIGVEALARWHRPTGAVGPDVFVPLAEECGLIVPMGYHILRTACLQMQEWRVRGFDLQTIAVNVSTLQLNSEGFLESVKRVLESTGLPGNHLELELTESALMANPERAKQVLLGLKLLGVQIALDDFGTGYSSLSYLKRFPVDTLKIDKSFIRDLASDSEGRKIVSAIVGLAKSLELNIVAEGVEDSAQQFELQEMHCDTLQGYLFSRPVSADQITTAFESQQGVKRAHSPHFGRLPSPTPVLQETETAPAL